MQFWNEYIAGVESIWCLLAASVFAFVLVTAKLIGAWSSQRLVHVAQDEAGATYMLPLVLMLPFYVLLIAMIIECTLILTTKIGCVGAAYSAARSAAVWLPYENAMPSDAPDYTPLEDRQAMVRLAVARAMWAYASGAKAHATDAAMDEFLNATINQQIAVFQAYSGNQKYDADYLKRKFAYAYNSSTVEIVYFDPENDKSYAPDETPVFNAKIQLTLRYEAPFHTAGIGRLFGERSQFGNHFVHAIVTTVVIENEGVKLNSASNKRIAGQSLGIRYYDRSPGMAGSRIRQPVPLPSMQPRQGIAVLSGGYDSRSWKDNDHRASQRLASSRNATPLLIDSTTDLSGIENLVLVMHGTKDQNGDGLPDVWFNTPTGTLITLNAIQLASLLRSAKFEGNSIELIACNSESYAQDLADALGATHPNVKVTGYPHYTRISGSGEAVVTSRPPFVRLSESGEIISYNPRTTFSSEATPVIKEPRLSDNSR